MTDDEPKKPLIQDAYLAFCAARALEAEAAGNHYAAHEWWEGIGLMMGQHFRLMELAGPTGASLEKLWEDTQAALTLAPAWFTNDRMLADPAMLDTEQGRIGFEIRAWIERECPAAVGVARLIVKEPPLQPPQSFGATKMVSA